jgi:phenylacetate-CoA ligase
MFRSLRFFNELRSNLYRDYQVLKLLQLEKLKKLLVHAYNTTDYYRKLFDEHNFNPNYMESTDDLKKVPILEKRAIQNNYDSILSSKFPRQKLIVHKTSGSTGMPLSVFCDKDSEAYNRALRYRAYTENGLSSRDVVVEVTSPENLSQHKFWFQRLGFFRREKLAILDDHMEMFKRINSIKPDVIECYPSVLNLIAQTCKKEDLKYKPKIIFTTAELLLPTWRRNIVKFFDCDVRDVYGSAEFYRLAWECEKHEGYHLDIDAHVIEFLDEKNNPVEAGDGYIVVTGLYNYAFPLIRYKIGDIAKLKEDKCSCGRSLPLIDSIQGREDDYIKLPSGKTISPRKINLMDSIEGVKQYTTTQVRENLIKVKVVKDHDFSEDIGEAIKRQILKGCNGEAISVEVELVGEIRRNAGKIRTVISLVK